MKNLLILVVLCLFLSGCAIPVSQADLLEMERSFNADIIVGTTTRTELIAKYGTPTRSHGNFNDGRTDYWINNDYLRLTKGVRNVRVVSYKNDIVTSRKFSTETLR